jgi:hypothetical protein
MIDGYDIDARVKREMTAGEIDKLCLKFEARINQYIEDRRTNSISLTIEDFIAALHAMRTMQRELRASPHE